MSRRHPPIRRWHVGDKCQVPNTFKLINRIVTHWEAGEVVAVRGDQVVVRRYRWETTHPWWELKPPRRHVGNSLVRALNRLGHDRSRRTF